MSEMNKQLEPKIRFEGFSEDWYKSQLGRLGDFKNGLNKDKEEFGFGIPFVNLMDVFGVNSLSSSANLSLVNANETEQKTYELLESDVLFIRSSVKATGVGLTAVILRNLEKTVYSGFLIRFREKSQKLDTSFKRYCFGSNHFRKRLLAVSTSSANTNVNQQELSRLCLKYPKIQEQTQIGNFFQQLDKLIELQTRAVESAEMYKKAMLQKMFPQKGEKAPRVRFEGFSGDWEESYLGDITDIKTGKKDVQDALEYGVYPFYIRSDEVKRIDTYSFDGEAILIPGEGRLGEIFHYINGRFDYHQRVYKISDFINVNGLFVLSFMRQNFKRHALTYTVKATVDSLRLPIIQSFLIKHPSLDEQIQIGNFFKKLDQNIEAEKKKLEKYQDMKKAMLQRMFV